jgi:hypothetical protein
MQLANPEAFATGEHPLFPGLTRRINARPIIGFGPPGKRAGAPKSIQIRTGQANTLSIMAAELLGPNIQLEGPPDAPNAGFWLDPKDEVKWVLVLPESAKFKVVINYASAQNTGGPFEIAVNDQRLRGRTISTGDYTKYADLAVGTLTFPAGRQALVVRPGGEFVFGLMNLRSITLAPER